MRKKCHDGATQKEHDESGCDYICLLTGLTGRKSIRTSETNLFDDEAPAYFGRTPEG